MPTLTSLALSLVASLALQPAPPPTLPWAVERRPLSEADKLALSQVSACYHAFYGQTYLPQPPLFRLADADTTIYLLGSVHVLPISFDWRTPELDEIVARSDMLITETGSTRRLAEPSDPPAKTTTSKPLIRDRLTGERRAKWIGISAVGEPWRIRELDQSSDLEAAMQLAFWAGALKGLGSGVETQLEAIFRKDGKPIGKLEEPGTGGAILATIPAAIQRKMLETSVDEVGEAKPANDPLATFHRWARGEVTDEPQTAMIPPDIRRSLLDKRNAAWVPEVRKLLDKPGTRLIVVGAAHLRGRNSLVDLLREDGLTVKRNSRTGEPLARSAFTPKPNSLSECLAYMPR